MPKNNKKTTTKKSAKKELFKKSKRSKSDGKSNEDKSKPKQKTSLHKRRKKHSKTDSLAIEDTEIPHDPVPTKRLTFQTASVTKIGTFSY
jgi:hypothetical protein